MSWTFLSAIFLPTLVIFLTLRFRSKPSSKPSSVGDDIKRTRAIANFTAFDAKSLNVRLRLRAGPNVRLTTAFGIRNSFTTTDDAEHLEFLRRAVLVIKSADGAAWRRVWTLANGRMDSLAPRDHGLRLNIERIARVLCFDAVLELLFPQTRVRPLDVGGADRATKLVNVLWLESKRDPAGTEASTARAYALESLHEAMRGLVSEPEEEALGLIMPAYETLWRVVLLTYVHVAFRYVDSETRDLVHEVVDVVSRNGGCRGARSQLHLNVDNFAREALRLYPPTKRIYRASDTLKVAADVESLHHDERIWGTDALEFRPGRFATLTQDQCDAYMPFGVGKNACPAANGFGNRAIAFLVVVLLSRLGSRESGARVCFGPSGLDRDVKAPLPNGRDDMEGWVVSLSGMDDVEPRMEWEKV
ncbi:hypothetical protein CPLU01_07410 [Colletotrichum plurivorum]|uniref:Cytochrome P450 n=1 Tax=Colletotrichum plurivorum TaxID=2175906 RepID=A0A8H6KFY9_9PEZI|nr:hypothetical protein CPLU01_07410 [Colletotrichum plurivorum]